MTFLTMWPVRWLGDRAQKFETGIGQVKYKQNEVSHDIFDHVTRQVTRWPGQKIRNWIGQVKYKQNEVSHDILGD